MSLQAEFLEALFGVDSSGLEKIVALIKKGANVNFRDGSHRTPLDYCLSLNPVCYSVDLSKKDDNGYICVTEAANLATPLRLKKAQILLRHGANPNMTDKFGWTIIHQCAWNGDLPFLQLCFDKGGDLHAQNNSNQLPIDLASTRGHTHVMRYLDGQSKDLKSICRLAIRDAMGKRCYNRLNELPLPSTIKLFLNFGNPYNGWKATLVPPQRWTNEQLMKNEVKNQELKEFISENASQDFIEENKDVLAATNSEISELVQAFQSMYVWEAFKDVDYQEPLARKPRYSMERVKKKEEKDKEQLAVQKLIARGFKNLFASD